MEDEKLEDKEELKEDKEELKEDKEEIQEDNQELNEDVSNETNDFKTMIGLLESINTGITQLLSSSSEKNQTDESTDIFTDEEDDNDIDELEIF